MQLMVESLRKQGKLYKKMQEISPGELGVRNKIKIYKATDVNGYFWAIFAISQKSKLLMRDVHKMEEIYQKLMIYCDHNFKHKILFLDAPICSKASEAFVAQKWKFGKNALV